MLEEITSSHFSGHDSLSNCRQLWLKKDLILRAKGGIHDENAVSTMGLRKNMVSSISILR